MTPSNPDDPTPGTLLIVDDEAPIRHALRREFKRAGFHVLECESPTQAVALTAEGGEQPSLAVLDYYMPGRDGVDLARDLRTQISGLPVLLVTAGHLEGDTKVREAIDDGTLVGVIRKPWNRSLLLETVKSILTGLPLPDGLKRT